MIVFFLFSVLAFFALGCGLLILGYRSRAHAAEARANALQCAWESAWRAFEGMKQVASEAIAVAQADKIIQFTTPPRPPSTPENYMASYVSPVVAFCPTCNVSVRHDPSEYPVQCPREGCGTLIDPTFDDQDLAE